MEEILVGKKVGNVQLFDRWFILYQANQRYDCPGTFENNKWPIVQQNRCKASYNGANQVK